MSLGFIYLSDSSRDSYVIIVSSQYGGDVNVTWIHLFKFVTCLSISAEKNTKLAREDKDRLFWG